jgi:hypothetical protein
MAKRERSFPPLEYDCYGGVYPIVRKICTFECNRCLDCHFYTHSLPDLSTMTQTPNYCGKTKKCIDNAFTIPEHCPLPDIDIQSEVDK